MKTKCVLGMISFLIGSAGVAQTRPAEVQVAPVQAPPAIGDPGVAAVPATNAESKAVKPAAKAIDAPAMPPEVQAAADAAELPVVTVRQNGNETIKEYRKNGKLLFRAVLNQDAPTRIYVDDPAVIPASIMQQLSGPSGQVQPVFYKLAGWK